MTRPLQPLPDHAILTTAEVAAALGCTISSLSKHCQAGRFPGAFQTPSPAGAGNWRIPRAAAVAAGRQMGVLKGD